MKTRFLWVSTLLTETKLYAEKKKMNIIVWFVKNNYICPETF